MSKEKKEELLKVSIPSFEKVDIMEAYLWLNFVAWHLSFS